MEEDIDNTVDSNRRDKKKDKKKIRMITKPNMLSLIASANINNIKKESIIQIVNGDHQYHLIYSD